MYEWVNSFVGVPYLVNGRSRAGWDCWGLVMAVFQEQCGVTLPDWRVSPTDDPHTGLAAAVRAISQGAEEAAMTRRAVEIASPEHMAIVIVARRRLPSHVGVMIGHTAILHCGEANSATVCEPFGAFLRQYPAITYWKWVG